jgi:hypothetical protein
VDHPGAAAAQRRHLPAVLANHLRLERRWDRPCLAYNACVRPGPAAAAALSAVQEGALDLEPSLLRVPARALHASLAWLLPVHQEFGRPKDELWQRHGPSCTSPAVSAPANWSTRPCSAMPGRFVTLHRWCTGSRPPGSTSTST